MREIVSPLDGFLSPFGRRGGAAADAYAIGGKRPPLVLDFIGTFSGYAYEALEPPLVLDFVGDRS
jgi:hypothetical protein